MARLIAIAFLSNAMAQLTPVAPDPANPRVWRWRGQSRVLVGSGEHYGAVLNQDFNETAYIQAVQAAGLSLVRVWTGATYVEPPGAFGIPFNTLAPLSGRYLAPWAVTPQCCYNNTPGVGRFDLSAWNATYWARWHAFMNATSQAGIVVNIGLVCIFYGDAMWQLSPFYAGNNVNGIGANITSANDLYTLSHPEVQSLLEAFAVRLVTELDGYDNWFLELINEPYALGNAGMFVPWVQRMAQVVAAAPVAHPHTLSHNYANVAQRVTPLSPNISYYSFHYMLTENVPMNAALGVPVGTEETGFAGTGDAAYRAAAWLTLLNGAASFSNLDYSFTVKTPDGSGVPVPPSAPGGGGPSLRASLGLLNRVLGGVNLTRSVPAPSALCSWTCARSRPASGTAC